MVLLICVALLIFVSTGLLIDVVSIGGVVDVETPSVVLLVLEITVGDNTVDVSLIAVPVVVDGIVVCCFPCTVSPAAPPTAVPAPT